jgi:hypothetical protein
VAAHWLSDDCDDYLQSIDIWSMGWNNSLEDYREYLKSEIYAKNLLSDIIAAFVIGLIGAFVGAFTGGIGGFITITVLYAVYTYSIKPYLNDYWKKNDLKYVRSHQVGEPFTDQDKSAWEYIHEGWDNYWAAFSDWGNKLFVQYEGRAYFTDINPFYIDIYNPSQTELEADSDYSVYVNYTYPQIWYPSANNWLAHIQKWKPMTDPFYNEYLHAYHNSQYSTSQPYLYSLIRAYLGDISPTYEQYIEAKARVLHRYYYRDDPTDGITLADNSGLGPSEGKLVKYSHSYKKYVEFATVKNPDHARLVGQPILTAAGGHKPFMNYSDPIAYEVDYVQMCLLSRYQTGYESCQEYNLEIFWRQLRDTVIITAAGVIGCFAGSAWGTSRKMGISFKSAFQEIFTPKNFLKAMVDELLLEQITSETLKYFGANDQFAEMMGEIFGLGNVIEGLSGNQGPSISTDQQLQIQQAAEAYATQAQQQAQTRIGQSQLAYNLRYMANLVKGFVRAKTIGLNDLRVGHEVMAYSAGYIKNGGGVNLQVRVEIINKVLGLHASEYLLSTTDLRQFEFAAQSKMLEFVGKCTSVDARAQIALLAAFINDGQLARIGNLDEGRYQFLRLQYTSTSGQTETIEITTHDSNGQNLLNNQVDVIRSDGTRVSLQNYLQIKECSSVLELLSHSSNFELVDPRVNFDGTERLKLGTLILGFLLGNSAPILSSKYLFSANSELVRFFDFPINPQSYSNINIKVQAEIAKLWFDLESQGIDFNHIKRIIQSNIIISNPNYVHMISFNFGDVYFNCEHLNHEYKHCQYFDPNLNPNGWNNQINGNGAIYTSYILNLLSDSELQVKQGTYNNIDGVHYYVVDNTNPLEPVYKWTFFRYLSDGNLDFLCAWYLNDKQIDDLNNNGHVGKYYL